MNYKQKTISYAVPHRSKNRLLESVIIIIFALVTIAINLRMIRDGVNGRADMIWHITWIQHFYQQLSEGIWYPRWIAGTNYGYGSPTFVFYSPLVYYIGSLLKFIGLNTEQTIISIFSLAIFLSGFNFYIYSRNRWGLTSSFLGALAYMTAPYLAYRIYDIGSVASAFSIALIPLCWWLTDKTISQPKWGIGLTIFWVILALTHLASLVISIMVWLPYTLFFLLNQSWKNYVALIISTIIGLGIASFYLLPAIIEKSLVNIDVMKNIGGGFQSQMIGSSTIYASTQQVFIYHSLAIAILTIIAFIFLRKDKKNIKESINWLFFALILAFFMSSLSLPIWQSSTSLQRIQTPLRLMHFFSFVGAAFYTTIAHGIFKLRLRPKVLLLLILIAILLFNFGFAHKLARKFPTINHPVKEQIGYLEHIKTALDDPYPDKLKDVPEYRPLLDNDQPPPKPIKGQPRFSLIDGKAKIKLQQWGSYNRLLKVTAEEASTIRIRTYYYPAWHLYINDKSHPINVLDDGTIGVKLEPGFSLIELRYQWTSIFILGTIISLISIVTLFLFWIKMPITFIEQ